MDQLCLPENPSPPEYRAVRGDAGRWEGVLADVAAGHGLAGQEVRPVATGSNLVAAVGGGWVVKAYPPFHRHQFEAERAALQTSKDEQPELADLTFRVRRLRKESRVGLPMVCPSETGTKRSGDVTCGSCRNCFT